MPQMRIGVQADGDVDDELVEWIDLGLRADPGLGEPVQVVADRTAVTAQMTRDRRDRPSLLMQGVCVTDSSCVNMAKRAFLELVSGQRPSASGKARPLLAEPHR